MFPPTALSSQRYKICFTRIQFLSEARRPLNAPIAARRRSAEPGSQTKALPLGAEGLGFSACLARSDARQLLRSDLLRSGWRIRLGQAKPGSAIMFSFTPRACRAPSF